MERKEAVSHGVVDLGEPKRSRRAYKRPPRTGSEIPSPQGVSVGRKPHLARGLLYRGKRFENTCPGAARSNPVQLAIRAVEPRFVSISHTRMSRFPLPFSLSLSPPFANLVFRCFRFCSLVNDLSRQWDRVLLTDMFSFWQIFVYLIRVFEEQSNSSWSVNCRFLSKKKKKKKNRGSWNVCTTRYL